MAVKTRERIVEIPDTVRVNADEIGGGHQNGNGNGHGSKISFKPRLTKLERLLTKAIDALKRHGWIQGELKNEYGMCLLGAIQFAATGEADRRSDVSNAAAHHVFRNLPKGWVEREGFDVEYGITEYNDSHSKRSVMAVLNRALKAARKA